MARVTWWMWIVLGSVSYLVVTRVFRLATAGRRGRHSGGWDAVQQTNYLLATPVERRVWAYRQIGDLLMRQADHADQLPHLQRQLMEDAAEWVGAADEIQVRTRTDE